MCQDRRQLFRLLKRFAARDGETIGFQCVMIDCSVDITHLNGSDTFFPSVNRNASRATNRTSLEPEAEAASRPQRGDREVQTRNRYLHGASARMILVIAPTSTEAMTAGRSTLRSKSARARGFIRWASSLLRIPRPPFPKSATHKSRRVWRASGAIKTFWPEAAASANAESTMDSKIFSATPGRIKSN